MPRLKVRLDNISFGWGSLFIFAEDKMVLRKDVSQIYSSVAQLVAALGVMLGEQAEKVVVWVGDPTEFELRFSRRDDTVRLEITFFQGRERPIEKNQTALTFAGSYDEVCLPFWQALRELEERYFAEKLKGSWFGYFPHRELALLTQELDKD